MKNNRVVAFGEALWDVYETGPDTFRREPGGAPANLVVALARLGVRSSIVCGVSKDAFGDALVDRLKKSGVDTRFVVRLPNRTGLAFVRRDGRGQPSFLFYRHETADMMVRPAHVHVPEASFAALGTSTLSSGRELASATWRFVDLAEKKGAAIAVDLNVRAHLWSDVKTMRSKIAKLAARASLIKASRDDLRAIGGVPFLEKHARDATWILTAGAGVAHADGEHGEVAMKALRAKCVDATGAGDAFFAGVLSVLAKRGAVPGTPEWRDPAIFSEALRVGHMLGAKVVSKVGAQLLPSGAPPPNPR